MLDSLCPLTPPGVMDPILRGLRLRGGQKTWLDQPLTPRKTGILKKASEWKEKGESKVTQAARITTTLSVNAAHTKKKKKKRMCAASG